MGLCHLTSPTYIFQPPKPQAGGTILEKELKDGEKLMVDQESLVGWQSTVSLGVRTFAGCMGCCSNVCGGEGCFMATLTGPGRIWITSMSFPKWYRVLAPKLGEGKTKAIEEEGGTE